MKSKYTTLNTYCGNYPDKDSKSRTYAPFKDIYSYAVVNSIEQYKPLKEYYSPGFSNVGIL